MSVQDLRFLGGAEKCHSGYLRGAAAAEHLHARHTCLDAASGFSNGPLVEQHFGGFAGARHTDFVRGQPYGHGLLK